MKKLLIIIIAFIFLDCAAPTPPPSKVYEFASGELVADLKKSVAHNKGWAAYTIKTFENGVEVGIDIAPTPGNETNSVDIQSSIDLPAGLTIQIIRK